MSQARALRLLSRAIEMSNKSQAILAEATQLLADAGTPIVSREDRKAAKDVKAAPGMNFPYSGKKAKTPVEAPAPKKAPIEISHTLSSEFSNHVAEISQEVGRVSTRNLVIAALDSFIPSSRKLENEFKRLKDEHHMNAIIKALIASN